MPNSSPTWSRQISGNFIRRLSWSCILAGLLISGCKEDQVVKPTTPDSVFTLRVGEHRVLEPRRTRLGFERVISDSRCPTHVVCVWAGEAKVRLWLVESKPDTSFFELKVPGPFAAAETLGLRIEPIDLEPHPEVPGPIPSESYRLTLKVTALPN